MQRDENATFYCPTPCFGPKDSTPQYGRRLLRCGDFGPTHVSLQVKNGGIRFAAFSPLHLSHPTLVMRGNSRSWLGSDVVSLQVAHMRTFPYPPRVMRTGGADVRRGTHSASRRGSRRHPASDPGLLCGPGRTV